MSSITPGSALAYPSSADRRPATDEPTFHGLTATAWLKISIIAALSLCLFWPNLRRLWDKTNPFYGEANWGHAIVIPLIGLYYLYINRERLLAAKVRTAWSGAGILLAGILLFAYGIYPGQNDFVKDFGMVVTLFGVVTLLAGWEVMKIAWFPIAFLVCGIPWPGLVYSWVAGPLQHLAAKVAVGALQMTGVAAENWGTKIAIPGSHGRGVRVLNVAEACAGLRSLMTFISVAAAVAFLSNRALWQKLVIVASALPIAIFCNVMRVAGQGLLDHYVSPELSESFAHQFVGLIMLIPAFFLILLVGWILDHLFIDEVDDKSRLKNRPPAIVTNPRLAVAGGGGTVAPVRATVTMPAQKPTAPKPPVAPASAAPVARPLAAPPRPAGTPSGAPAPAAKRPAPPPAPAAPAAKPQPAPSGANPAASPAPAPARPVQAKPAAAPAKPAGQPKKEGQ